MVTFINSGIIVISILMIRKFALNRVTSRYRYSLWIFLAVYLLFSPFVHYECSFSTESVLKNIAINSAESINTYGTNVYPLFPEMHKDNGEINDDKEGVSEEQKYADAHQEGISNMIFAVWAKVRTFVSCVLIIFLIVSNVIFFIKCKKKRIYFRNDLETGLKIYLLDDIYSPFLLGHAVYLAPSMTRDIVKMRYMILHEYCHYKNKDLLWNVLKWTVFCLYWYNPFIWLAMVYIKRDCELACDEVVVRIIGDENKVKYGETLIDLLVNTKRMGKSYFVNTMMKGGKKQMKERINQLVVYKTKSYAVAVLSCMCILVLTGFAFSKTEYFEENDITATKEYAVEEKIIVSEEKGEEINRSTDGCTNDYYNYCKSSGDNMYYADAVHLYKVNTNSEEHEILLNGKFKLGNIDSGYIYYIRQPNENDRCGISRMSLDTLQEELLVQWEESFWKCSNIFAAGDEIYLEVGEECIAYRIENGKVVLVPKEENGIVNRMKELKIDVSNMNRFAPGYVNAFFLQRKVIYHDGSKLVIYDLDNDSIFEINNFKFNIMVTDQGVVYTGTDGNIWIKKWKSGETEVLYEGDFLNYGSYNQKNLFVFEEKENYVKCFKLSYTGELSEVISVDNMSRAVDLLFSAYDDYICFYRNQRLEVISL